MAPNAPREAGEISYTAGPCYAVPNHDGRHHTIPVMAPFECDESAPYHPCLGYALHGRGNAPRAIAEANAKLWAAAPELLACVQAELALYDAMLAKHPAPGVSPEAKARMDAMRAAIKKAIS